MAELWPEAYQDQMDGELDRATECCQRSIEADPAAQASTFLGWALSVHDRFDTAGRSRSTPLRQIHTTTLE